MRNCGECLMRDVDVIQLDPKTGICPKCGANYGKPFPTACQRDCCDTPIGNPHAPDCKRELR